MFQLRVCLIFRTSRNELATHFQVEGKKKRWHKASA